MLAAVYDVTNRAYIRQMIVSEISEDNLKLAQTLFMEYRKKNVILNESFNDDVWILSNQKEKYTVSFSFSEVAFYRNASKWIGCNNVCYKNCTKAYLIFSLGALSLDSLKEIQKQFLKVAESNFDAILQITVLAKHVLELLKIIPGRTDKREQAIEKLDENISLIKYKRNSGEQRDLADFNSYFEFEELINEFWEVANAEEKIFYFPLYFWWKLTSILPLRPSEFLLTPRKCLEVGRNGEKILKIRRTKLKGGTEKITYRIDGDYELKKYVITEALFIEINNYINATQNMKLSEIGTLISREPYCNHVKNSIKIKDRYFSYSDICITLEYFYEEHVKNSGRKIEKINLGDTRHLAMASLIITGGSPIICKELAGHSDINISSHYYTNISNLVECMTLNRYRKQKGKTAIIQGENYYKCSLPRIKHRVSEGWCDYDEIRNGDVSECSKVIDENGQIGNCNYCKHYWPDVQGLRLEFFDEVKGKNKVDFDCVFLMKMIELTRKGIGCSENIERALLRLQRSSDHYGKCLWEKYTLAEEELWQDQKKSMKNK